MDIPTDIYRADIPPPLSKISTVSAVGVGVYVCVFFICLPVLENFNHLIAIFISYILL